MFPGASDQLKRLMLSTRPSDGYCEDCGQWTRIDGAAGQCGIDKEYTSAGASCFKYTGGPTSTVKPRGEHRNNLYTRAVNLLEPGKKVSTTILHEKLRCTWIEAAGLIQKLFDDGKIGKEGGGEPGRH